MAANKRTHAGWIVLLVLIILPVLSVATVYVYATHHAFDVESVRASQTEATQTVSEAFDFGSVTVTYSPARVYELIETDTLNEELNQLLRGTARLDVFAIEPHQLNCTVYAKITLFGFLPVTLRGEADITAQNGSIGVWLESLELGTEISLPLEKLGVNRSFTLSPSAPVVEVETAEEGFYISYRFLQDHFTEDLRPDSVLIDDYSRYCPHEADTDWSLSLWSEKGTISKSRLLTLATDRETLIKILALADDSAVDTLFNSLSDFEKETLFPVSREAVEACKAPYKSATLDAYSGLSQALEDTVSYAKDKYFYLSNDTVTVRSSRITAAEPIEMQSITVGCSLIDPDESVFVLLYSDSAPVPPAAEEEATFQSLEAHIPAVKDMLLRNYSKYYSPALITRYCGDIPCILYRDTDGNIVISEIDEASYEVLSLKPDLILLDEYQSDAGTVYTAPCGSEGTLPSLRWIEQ